MKDQPQHFHKEAQPTVIHDPTADETLVAQWLRRGMEKGAGYWALVLGAIVVIGGGLWIVNSVMTRPSTDSLAWREVIIPSTAGEAEIGKYEGEPAQVRPLLSVADRFPRSPAGLWARYQVGLYYYQEGIRDLPNNKDAANPVLGQALDAFKQVLDLSGPDDHVRRFALMGKARALESRGELEEARTAYQQVAEEFPDSELGRAATKRADVLGDPRVVAFYKDLYASDFSRAEGSAGSFPGIGSSHPGTQPFGNPLLPPAIPGGFGAEDLSIPTRPQPPLEAPSTTPGLPTLPENAFPGTPETSKPAEAPATESAAPPAEADLPANVFVPSDDENAAPQPKG
jgi:hypothetical protein